MSRIVVGEGARRWAAQHGLATADMERKDFADYQVTPRTRSKYAFLALHSPALPCPVVFVTKLLTRRFQKYSAALAKAKLSASQSQGDAKTTPPPPPRACKSSRSRLSMSPEGKGEGEGEPGAKRQRIDRTTDHDGLAHTVRLPALWTQCSLT